MLNINTTTNAVPIKSPGDPIISHIPVKTANIGYDLLISCQVDYTGSCLVQLMVRKLGFWSYNITNMTFGFGSTYYIIFPAANLSTVGIEYYFSIYVNENLTVTYPYANASDNAFKVKVIAYNLDFSPTIIYVGLIAIVIFASLYAIDIIEIKNPWGGKKK